MVPKDPAAPAPLPFDSIYAHGFLRAAVCTPPVRVADPEFNLEHTLAMARRASANGAGIAVFPELGLSAYTNEDLVQQDALLDEVERCAQRLVVESKELTPVLVVGLPLRLDSRLFNCAAVIHRGRLLGLVPKSYLPSYREFHEKRWFTSGRHAVSHEARFMGQVVPFGNDLIFQAANYPGYRLFVELCEDLWPPVPPSTWAALAGATVLANLSASNATVGKAEYRRQVCASQSAKCLAAYLFAAAGPGESTTDLAWDGHGLIYENDELLAESERYARDGQLIHADIDLERLRQERMRMTSFNDCAAEHRERLRAMRRVSFEFELPAGELPLAREVERFPYVPAAPGRLDARCYEAFNIQIHGLLQRLQATGIERVVIGVSGGLDSTHALLVAAKTFDRLGLPRSGILGYSLPGFATSSRTRDNALALMRALGATTGEIDIRPAAERMLASIGHPSARGERVYDRTFENVQAGERASHLFRLANLHGGLVVGTSDLSELALGWTTYGVGDHMAHYAINASVPKTLVRHLVRWAIRAREFDAATNDVLSAIVDTTISPELVPGDEETGEPAQRTEDLVGPYALQDFNLYFLTRYGFLPSKVAYLAHHAWRDVACGAWPDAVPPAERVAYDLPTITRWLEVFLRRFFEQSQFKRSAMPNGPKVGSGGSLSPRGDWRAPSDATAETWISELRLNVPPA